jgi:hypothetical protein
LMIKRNLMLLLNLRAKPSPLALKQIEDLLRGFGERGKDLLLEFFPEEEN